MKKIKYSFEKIISSKLLLNTIQKTLGNIKFEIIKRPGHYIIRPAVENGKTITRILLLSPKGYTGNKIDLLNPHPEARTIRIRVLGKLKPANRGYSPLGREIKFVFSLKRDMPTEKGSPYAKCSKRYCSFRLVSWRNWLYTTRENGWGNFHSLTNLSNDWVAVVLEKNLIDQQPIELKAILDKLPSKQKNEFRDYLSKIKKSGDKIFEYPQLTKLIFNLPTTILVPAFIQMLNIKETGKHEPCTFFALLLKLAKKDKQLVLKEVNKALELKSAPYYYLEDLMKKLKR